MKKVEIWSLFGEVAVIDNNFLPMFYFTMYLAIGDTTGLDLIVSISIL